MCLSTCCAEKRDRTKLPFEEHKRISERLMREIEELIACFYHFLFQHLIFVNENTDFASTLKARCFTLLTKLESPYALFATFSCAPSCTKECNQHVFLLPSSIYDVRSKPLDFNWFWCFGVTVLIWDRLVMTGLSQIKMAGYERLRFSSRTCFVLPHFVQTDFLRS